MTRINVVDVTELTGKHLVAEYRELPRIFAQAHNAHVKRLPWYKKQPVNYTLGTGHVTFFYNRLKYLADRHQALVQEMLNRGYKPNFTASLEEQWRDKIPANYWHNYQVTEEALRINRERIADRIANPVAKQGKTK